MSNTPVAHRLGDALLAGHYHIHLCATPRSKRFTGLVTVSATRTAHTGPLTLHARKLEVVSAEARQGRTTIALAAQLDGAQELVHLRPQAGAPALSAGPLTLTIAYRGALAESMHGLYLAQDGPEVALVTQCEASDARAIVPCLDEPAHKATFAWRITTEAGLDVIANGRPAGSRRSGRQVTYDFAPTAKMSTYLLAVTIGRFEGGRKKTVAGVPCQIWAGRGKRAQTAFALDVTSRVLPWYVSYFKQPYAYHKLDQVAVPGFDAGAMENSGAIFYRQSLLLMDTTNTSRAAQKRIAEVIAHEIAHQWFGNLVTMQWWDDLWLNEAFATWIAFKVCNELYPDWQIWLDYLEAKEAALAADALATTHPIYAPVASPAQATELFDVITYEKGCGVLRMVERYLGSTGFRAGIRRYIAKHRFANAEGKALWHHVGQATGEDVADMMRHWIRRPGFPLVQAEWRSAPGEAVLALHQSRFYEATAQAKAQRHGGKDAEVWPIPMVIVYHDGKTLRHKRYLMRDARAEVSLPAAKGAQVQWAYANDDASGFYRLQMPAAQTRAVLAHGAEALGTSGRMSLLTDQWALVRAGYGRIELALDAFVTLGADPHPSVFRAIAGRLRSIHSHLLAEADSEAFAQFTRQVASAHFDRLGHDIGQRRSAQEATLFASVLDTLGVLARDPDVLESATQWQRKEEHDPYAIDANIAGSVVALSAIGKPRAHFAHLLEVYQARKQQGATPELQGRYLSALCMAEEGPCLSLVLAACDDGRIPQEQLRSVIAVLLQRRKSGVATWQWLTDQWASVAPKVGAMGIARLVESTGALPYKMHDEVQAFFAAHPVAEAERAVKKSAEAMALWEGLRQRESQGLSTWLRRRV